MNSEQKLFVNWDRSALNSMHQEERAETEKLLAEIDSQIVKYPTIQPSLRIPRTESEKEPSSKGLTGLLRIAKANKCHLVVIKASETVTENGVRNTKFYWEVPITAFDPEKRNQLTRDALLDKLTPRFHNFSCPLCNSKAWALQQEPAELSNLESNPFGKRLVIPVHVMTCTVCAYLMLFNSIQLGVVEGEKFTFEKAPVK